MADKNTANIGFEKQIWNAACVLRGNMDASEYKNVVTHIFADDISTATVNTCPTLGDLVTVIDNRGKTPPLTTETFEYPIIDVGYLRELVA